jgi:hypothetical protein
MVLGLLLETNQFLKDERGYMCVFWHGCFFPARRLECLNQAVFSVRSS